MPARLFPKQFDYLHHAKPFLVSLCVVLALIVGSLFVMIYSRTDDLILKRVREQSSAYVDLINHMKTWNFDYGGVYVEKRPGVESNIYLKNLGINPDVQAGPDKTFTVRNHAIMTKEISRISEKREGIKFRMVSLHPLDPENRPDAFEEGALRTFERKGTREAYTTAKSGEHATFRYLVPLYVDRTCLECHSTQGYKVGSVIGAISLSIPVESLLHELWMNKMLIIGGGIITVGFLISVCYFLTIRLVIRLEEAQRHLRRQATTDELTGLKNRRRIMSRLDEEFQRSCRLGEPLCLIIIDIDLFKRINDSYGHLFGDVVLKEVSRRMQETLRKYDIIGRIGGEEFLIVAPGTVLVDGVVLADRLRNTISQFAITDGQTEVTVTASAGVTIADDPDDTMESALRRADNALYKAKREGRDRAAVL